MIIKTIVLILVSMFIWLIGFSVSDKQLHTIILYTSGGLLIAAIIVMMQYGYYTIVLPDILPYNIGGQIEVI